MTAPDPGPVLDLIEAFRRSKTMFAGVSLGIFDRLETSPCSASDLAREQNLSLDALERLLDGLVGLGLLRREGVAYHNTPVASTYLCSHSPQRLTGYIDYSNRVLFSLWSHLEDAVREGTHRWKQAFGLEGAIFSHFFRTDEAMREFLLGMHGFGQLTSPRVVSAFDLSSFQRLVDLGGATGHLAIAACQRYPNLQAVVFDLPRALPLAIETTSAAGLDGRITCQGGDFFQDDLPSGDLFALGRILHDWDEPKVARLLAKIYAALPPRGALLIAEKLLDEDKRGPVPAQMQSLSMLLCTEGKERTLSEYTTLLQGAGFQQIEGRRTGSPLDAVLAYKDLPSASRP